MIAIALAVVLGLVPPAWAQFASPPGVTLRDEGTAQGRVRALDCVGTGVTCSVSAGVGTLTISGGGGYTTIEDEGSALTQRATVNFTGSGITCTDSGGKTVCDVTSGGGSGLDHPAVMRRVSLGF